LHYDQRVVLAGFPIRLLEPVGVAPAVLELEAVDGHDFSTDFEAGVDIEKPVEALARRDAVVISALRTNINVFFKIGVIQHGFALATLDPQSFRHAFSFTAGLAFYFRWSQFAQ